MPTHLKTLETHARNALQPALEGHLSPAERIALYKRFLKIEEHRIFMRHRAGADGLEIARARAELIDTIVTSIFEAAVIARGGIELPIALVATGGYGRFTLNPGSDVDLLFLLPRASTKLPKASQELLQEILYLLWDVGFKVGHACRSITECIQEATKDQLNKTALIDARLIAGDSALFAQFEKRFSEDCLDKNQREFFDLRRQDLRTRHKKYSYTVFLQEPNVKEGCGGMRDYHNIRWVARVNRGSSDLADLVEGRLITANTRHEIEAAVGPLISCTRIHLLQRQIEAAAVSIVYKYFGCATIEGSGNGRIDIFGQQALTLSIFGRIAFYLCFVANAADAFHVGHNVNFHVLWLNSDAASGSR